MMKNVILILLLLLVFIGFSSCSKGDDPAPYQQEETPPEEEDPVEEEPTDLPTGFTGEVAWVNTLGGSGIDEANDIIATSDGNYLIVGNTYSNDGDVTGKTTTDSDYWLIKINSSGGVIWNRVYGTEEDEVATHVSNTNDGGYIVAGYSRGNNCAVDSNQGFHDYWFLKLNAQGDEEWCKNYGFGGSDQAFDIFQTSDGGYFATGYFDVSASGGEGNADRSGQGTQHGVGEFWCMKLDASGEYYWTRYYGGTNNDRSYDALETADGGFLLFGHSESDDFDITDSKGSYDYWVVKVSGDGVMQWTKSFGGLGIDVAYAATQAPNGNYFIVGDSRSNEQDVTQNYGNADLWLVEMNPSGGLVSQKSFGGSQFDTARGIEVLSGGYILMTGASGSSDNDVSENKGFNDMWVVILNPQKELVFEKSIGGSNIDFGEAVVVTPDGSVISVGDTESSDGNIAQNKGSKDILIVKIN